MNACWALVKMISVMKLMMAKHVLVLRDEAVVHLAQYVCILGD